MYMYFLPHSFLIARKVMITLFAEIYAEPFHTKLIAIIHPNPLPRRIWRINVLTHRCCFYSIYIYFLFFIVEQRVSVSFESQLLLLIRNPLVDLKTKSRDNRFEICTTCSCEVICISETIKICFVLQKFSCNFYICT